MALNTKEITKLINECELNIIRTHLLTTVIKYESIIKEEIIDVRVSDIVDIIDKNIDYMKGYTGSQYGSLLFAQLEYLDKVEKFYDEIKKMLLNNLMIII